MTTYYGKAAKATLDDNCPGWEDIGVDKQESFNHTDCPAGEDKRGRLGVKNIGHSWLWHCFNCGENGYYRPKEVFSKLVDSKDVLADEGLSYTYSPLESFNLQEEDYDKFNVNHQLWLSSYGFMRDEVRTCGIRSGRVGVYLPAYFNGEFVGYQLRNFMMDGPKYVTRTSKNVANYTSSVTSNKLVLVEDLLSMYKVGMAGFNAVCLMGTKLNIPASELPPAKHLVVWLDEDSAGSAGAIALNRELAVLYDKTHLISYKQPKELSQKDIQTWLTT